MRHLVGIDHTGLTLAESSGGVYRFDHAESEFVTDDLNTTPRQVIVRTRAELDLTNQNDVERFFSDEQPDCVILAAAKVGGIHANNIRPAEFLHQNLAIQTNVIHQAHAFGVKRLLFLGSSCIYPRDCPQPIKESYLLTGPLEKTNEAYAIAKIAGVKMCEAYRTQYGDDFRSIMPTNLYGPHDNYDLQNSHVLAALLIKATIARKGNIKFLPVWGSGSPLREFMHADDLASAAMRFLLSEGEASIINVGSGAETSIYELARLVCSAVMPDDTEIVWDTTKPDGTPRKLLDCEWLRNSGWFSRIELCVPTLQRIVALASGHGSL